jgi:MATE family multidrug resistance protein
VSADPPTSEATATLRETRSTAGREAGDLLSLAWPVALAYLGTVGMGVVDTMMVGRLGAAPLAAVALANTWNFGVVILALGAARGLDPVVSQAHGAGDTRTAGLGLSLGVAMAALLAPFVIVLFGLAEPALRLLGQPHDLLEPAASYCRALIWGVPGLLGFIVGRQFLQAVGEMRPGTVAVFLANGVNALLNWMLIYGKLGLPALGALGSGYATSIAQWFMLAALVVLARRRFREHWLGWSAYLPWRSLRRLLALGLPVGFQMGLEVWAFHAAGLLMGRIGTLPLAAHAIAINLSTVSFMVPSGLSAAAATRVGHLLGGGRAWTATARIAMVLGAAVMVVPAVVFTFFPGDLAALYTKDVSVVAVAALLLPLAGMFQLFDGVQVVAFGVLRGAGDVNVPSLANAVGYWMLGLPVGWALAFRLGWGPRGIWSGLALAVATVAVLLVIRVGWIGRNGGIRRLVDP